AARARIRAYPGKSSFLLRSGPRQLQNRLRLRPPFRRSEWRKHPPDPAKRRCVHNASFSRFTKALRAKWVPVRVKKTRQNKKVEPGSDSIRTEMALRPTQRRPLNSLVA